MGWNGSGSVTRSHDWTDDRDAGVKILASRHDTHDADLATAIAACLAKNGENSATGNLNIGGYRLTSVGTATALTDAPNATGIQNSSHVYAADGSTTANTHTLTLSPAVTSYVAGQRFIFKSGSTNTGAATLNVNGLGAKSLVKGVSTALAAGDITSGEVVEAVYDGNNFQIPTLGTGAISFTSITTTGDITVGDDVILDSDAAEIQLGDNQEVKIIHDHDKGIILKHTATADDKPVSLTLQTGETDIAADDVLGKIDFQAPDEGTGTDAILVAAGIEAVSEGDFSSSSNATSLVFKTGASEAAAAKLKITSAGHLVPASDDSVDLGTSSLEFKDAYFDGTVEADAYTIAGTTLAEYIADTAGAMFSSNTETGGTLTYQDGDNTIDFAIDAAQTTITSLLATDIKIGEDDQTKIDFGTANEIHLYADNANQVKIVDGAIVPAADNDIDLGTSSVEFKDAYFDGTVTSDAFAGPLSGNATTATALETGRTIAMTGDVTWTSASFDGSGNVTGTAAIGSGVIVNADVNSSAAIAFSKMADLTASRALVSDGSGDVSVSDVTSTELGVLDGGTAASSITLADADRVVTNDDGTMKQVAMSTVKSYIDRQVLQVVSATSNSETSTTSTSFVDTNLTASITPASSSNKVLILFNGNINIGGTRGNWCYWTIERGSTNISGEDDGYGGAYIEQDGSNFDLHVPVSGSVLDSPSSTSSTTYTIQIRVTGGTGKFLQNQPHLGSIILMEIAG